jgi:SAM-dependent methyltransferase
MGYYRGAPAESIGDRSGIDRTARVPETDVMPTITDFYDPYLYELGAGDADTGDTLSYYRDKIGAEPQRVLDIGAGTGRFAIPLVADGHDVLALDRSARMLNALERRAPSSSSGTLRVALRAFGPRNDEAPVNIAIAPDDFLLHLMSSVELSAFFRDLTSWFRSGGRLVTDVRPRDAAALEAASRPPYALRCFPLIRDESGQRGVSYVHVAYWEVYSPSTQLLETTCHYQFLDDLGEVRRSFMRILRQRMHTSAEICEAAIQARFSLAEHSMRNCSSEAPSGAIGGSFVFHL